MTVLLQQTKEKETETIYTLKTKKTNLKILLENNSRAKSKISKRKKVLNTILMCNDPTPNAL